MQELITRAKELLADGTVVRVLGWLLRLDLVDVLEKLLFALSERRVHRVDLVLGQVRVLVLQPETCPQRANTDAEREDNTVDRVLIHSSNPLSPGCLRQLRRRKCKATGSRARLAQTSRSPLRSTPHVVK